MAWIRGLDGSVHDYGEYCEHTKLFLKVAMSEEVKKGGGKNR